MARRDSGFTLIELLIVVVIIGAVSLIAFPKLKAAYQASALRGARTRVITVYNAAKAAAVQTNRPVRVHITAGDIWVTATPRMTVGGSGTADTISPVQSLYHVYGVLMFTSVDSLMLDPRGLGLNGGTIVFANGSKSDTLRITGYGRVVR